MAKLSKLAEEMMAQILSRLPPKSLMRFKCIHTSWHALINNPNFVTKHLSVSKHNKLSSFTTILFKRYVLKDMNTDKRNLVLSLFKLFCDDDDDDYEDHHLDAAMDDLYIPPSKHQKKEINIHGFEHVQLSGHCDGIICLTDRREFVALCNPSIKEFRLLPVSSLLLSSPCFESGCDPIVALGIGYDLKSKTYKVVRIMQDAREITDDDHVIIHPPKAEVYSLVTNNWKEIKTDSLVKDTVIAWPLNYIYAANPIYCKGIIYWSAQEFKKESMICDTPDEDGVFECLKYCTISFHLADETFHVISSPEYSTGVKMFGLWNESIAISGWNIAENFIIIWVLDEIGGTEGSWTNYFIFHPIVSFSCPLAFVKKNDRFLFVATDQCVVIFYDFLTKKFKYFPMEGVDLRNYEAVFYIDSIVSIKGDNNAVRQDNCSDIVPHCFMDEEV